MARHQCNKQDIGRNRLGWSHCIVCEGREHEPDCTTKRDPKKDCCPTRHKVLYDTGHTRGLIDNSFLMYNGDCVRLFGALPEVDFTGINPTARQDYEKAVAEQYKPQD